MGSQRHLVPVLWLLMLGGLVTLCTADFGRHIVDEAVDLDAVAEAVGVESGDNYEDLLHWAISHSDPAKLAEQAEDARRVEMVKDLKEQRRRVKELLDHVRQQPTEADMIREGISILSRPTASDTELLAALQALQVLVEPIDNANDLPSMGGLAPVVAQLLSPSPQLAAAAAHVLGTAASNNPKFQKALLTQHPHVLPTLLKVCEHPEEECAVKGVYALAALVRNLPRARALFMEAGGFRTLEALLRGSSSPSRVKRKALSLFMDLMDTQPAAAGPGTGPGAGPGPDGDADGLWGTEGQGVGLGGAAASDDELHVLRVNLAADEGDQATAGTGQQASSAGGGSKHVSDSEGSAGGATRLAAAAIGTGLPEAVVGLLREGDTDMQEKALLVVQRLAGDAVARRVLHAHGAGEALAALRLQLQADGPQPGDEPDPYHEYMEGLADTVNTLLHQPQQQQEGAQQQQGEQQGAAAAGQQRQGRADGEAGRRGGVGGRGGSGGEEGRQEVLALGGPPPRARTVVDEGVCGGQGQGRERCEL